MTIDQEDMSSFDTVSDATMSAAIYNQSKNVLVCYRD